MTCHRCPSVFAIFWRLVEPFVPPATATWHRLASEIRVKCWQKNGFGKSFAIYSPNFGKWLWKIAFKATWKIL